MLANIESVAGYTATLRNGHVSYTDPPQPKDVRIYTWGIVIENRGRERRLAWAAITPSTESRLRAIARKIRPTVHKRRRSSTRRRSNGCGRSRTQPSAAAVLASQQGRATTELVKRVNGEKALEQTARQAKAKWTGINPFSQQREFWRPHVSGHEFCTVENGELGPWEFTTRAYPPEWTSIL